MATASNVRKVGDNTWVVTYNTKEGEVRLTYVRRGNDVYLLLNGRTVKAFSLTGNAKGQEEGAIEESLRKSSLTPTRDITTEGYSADTIRVEKKEGYFLTIPSVEKGRRIYTMSYINNLPISKRDIPQEEVKPPQPTKTEERQRRVRKKAQPVTEGKATEREKGKAFTYTVGISTREVKRFFGLRKERQTTAHVTYNTDKGPITYSIAGVGGGKVLGVADVGKGVVRIEMEVPPTTFGSGSRVLYGYLYPSGEVKWYDKEGKEVKNPFANVTVSYEAAKEATVVSEGRLPEKAIENNPHYQKAGTPLGKLTIRG